jgi:hypothetical protein
LIARYFPQAESNAADSDSSSGMVSTTIRSTGGDRPCDKPGSCDRTWLDPPEFRGELTDGCLSLGRNLEFFRIYRLPPDSSLRLYDRLVRRSKTAMPLHGLDRKGCPTTAEIMTLLGASPASEDDEPHGSLLIPARKTSPVKD